jgi:hypothetical protein
MKNQLLNLTFEVEVRAGEKLSIPDTLIEGIGEGKWLITIQPNLPTRAHNSFLNSYSSEDEGLYDDY